MSDSVGPYRWQPTRLPRPWDSPSKNTGVGCHFLLQCMKVKNESEVAQSCLTLSHPVDCSPSGSSTHGIFQARVLECLGEDKYCKGGGWAEVQGLLNRKYIFPLLSCSHLSLYKGLFFFSHVTFLTPPPNPTTARLQLKFGKWSRSARACVCVCACVCVYSVEKGWRGGGAPG